MIQKSKRSELEAIKCVAQFMCAAARTAPKARGVDNIETIIISGPDITKLSKAMRYYAEKENKPSFERDAQGIAKCSHIVLIGTRIAPVHLSFCGFCGWPTCEKMQHKGGICAYNTMDLGIAIGSAVSVASNFRIDNRIMYSAGIVAIKSGFLPAKVKIAVGIPLSATGKNIFFDRK